MPDTGARRSSFVDLVLERVPPLAQLDLAELEVAQLGDRLARAPSSRAAPARSRSRRSCRGSRRCSPRPGPAVPRSRASSRCSASTRVIWVRPCVEQRLLAARAPGRAARSATSSPPRARTRPSICLAICALLLGELLRLLGLQLAAGLELLLLRGDQRRDLRRSLGARDAARGRSRSRRARRARRASRLLRARISNHWPSTMPSSEISALALELDQHVARLDHVAVAGVDRGDHPADRVLDHLAVALDLDARRRRSPRRRCG